MTRRFLDTFASSNKSADAGTIGGRPTHGVGGGAGVEGRRTLFSVNAPLLSDRGDTRPIGRGAVYGARSEPDAEAEWRLCSVDPFEYSNRGNVGTFSEGPVGEVGSDENVGLPSNREDAETVEDGEDSELMPGAECKVVSISSTLRRQ